LSFQTVVLRSGLLGGELNVAHHDALVAELTNTTRTGPANGKLGIEEPAPPTGRRSSSRTTIFAGCIRGCA